MELIKKTLFVSLVFGLLLSCKSYHSRFEMKKKNEKKSIKYLEIYTSKNEKKDTLHLFENVYSIKYSFYEFHIGKIKKGIKYGKWYLYDIENDSTKCYTIEKINKQTQKSKIIWADGLYNRPFF